MFRANHLAVVGLIILILLIGTAIFAPLLAPASPYAQNLAERLQPPSAAHWLGTDHLGRDILSRLIWGSRITLFIVGTVALISPLIGLIVGTLAGFAGGWVDQVLMRITDIFLAFPKLILALAFVAALGPSITNAVLALAITGWPPYARLARAETLTIRNADFIAAARMQGASPLRLLVLHIWPLCLSSLILSLIHI